MANEKAKLTTVSFFIHMFVLSYCLKLIYKAHPQTALTCLDSILNMKDQSLTKKDLIWKRNISKLF